MALGRIDPIVERRASLRRHIERARAWSGAIQRGEVENAAAVAARENLTRARVSQVLKLLTLAPSILEDICDPQRTGPVPSEHILRKVAMLGAEATQVKRYQRLIEQGRRPAKERTGIFGWSRLRRRGFQHLFAQARQLRAMCETGQYGSLRELGQAVGWSAERVGQVLNLLNLAPDIIEKLDVPAEQRPGLTSGQMRELARIREHKVQREQFAVLAEGTRE